MSLKSIPVFAAIAILAACSTSQKEKKEEAPIADPNYVGEEISYNADTLTMNGYIAYSTNDSSRKPGIIVVHEWWGHNEYTRERADLLAELGYVALAIDMYGGGKQATHPEDAGKFAGEVFANIEGAKVRFESALNVLKNHPNVDPDKIGAIGYCFGGSVVLTMANAGYDLDAVVGFHCGLTLPILPDSTLTAKILVANGADDPFIAEEHIVDFKAVMDAVGADYKYIAYEGAIHAFTSKYADDLGEQFELPLAYNAAADSASWEEMKALFAEVF